MYGVPDGESAPSAAEDPAVQAAEDVARLFDRPGLGRLERLARKATTHSTSSPEADSSSVPSGQPREGW